MIVKIGEVEYTFHNEEKRCGNCAYYHEKIELDRNNEGNMWPDVPQFHPCKGCLNFEKWKPSRKILYQIIEYLQKKQKKMGTRHLTAVILKDEPKIAQYGQWDGYPNGQGKTVLNFLKTSNLEKFKKEVAKCVFIGESEFNEKWAEAGANGSGSVTLDVAKRMRRLHPELTRDVGAKVLYLIYQGKTHRLLNRIDFANDSLFCEWAYVIDLDSNIFEVYKGFNTLPLLENDRFFNEGYKSDKEHNNDDGTTYYYYPIRLIKAYSLSNLPSEEDFINDLEPEDEEDE